MVSYKLMEGKQQRVGKPITVKEVTVIPLEERKVYHSRGKQWLSFTATSIPVGVVIASSKGKWACDTKGGNMPLKTLIEDFEGLEELLNNT